jgi:hypothetical protein
MPRHTIFDRTERLFTKGQRALDRQEYAAAASHLACAIDTDPAYPHPHMYLGIALSEMGKFREAEAALRKAASLAVDNFVFPMHLGIVHLDAGDTDAAERHFRRAHGLASDNILVNGYLTLCRWDQGDDRAVRDLLPILRDVPRSLQSRALLRIEERRLSLSGPEACADSYRDATPPALASPNPGRVSMWIWKRQLLRAQRELLRGTMNTAARYVLNRPDLLSTDTGRALLAHAQHGDAAVLSHIASWLANSSAAPELRPMRIEVLLRLAEVQEDLRDYSAARDTLLDAQRELRRRDDAVPAALRAAVLLRLAIAQVRVAAFAEANTLALEALRLDTSPEPHWVRAVACIGVRDRRAARQCLEAFLARRLFRTDLHVHAFLAGVLQAPSA